MTERPRPSREHVLAYFDLVDACEQFLLAGLRREIGPEGDLQAAHQAWYDNRMREHDRDLEHMLTELARAELAFKATRSVEGESPPSPFAPDAVS